MTLLSLCFASSDSSAADDYRFIPAAPLAAPSRKVFPVEIHAVDLCINTWESLKKKKKQAKHSDLKPLVIFFVPQQDRKLEKY